MTVGYKCHTCDLDIAMRYASTGRSPRSHLDAVVGIRRPGSRCIAIAVSGVGSYVFEVPLADAMVLDDGESVKDVSSMRRLNGKRPTTTSISEACAGSDSRRLYG